MAGRKYTAEEVANIIATSDDELTDLDTSAIESDQDNDGDAKEPDYVNEDGVHELVPNELLMETGVMAVTALLGQSGMEEPAMCDSLLLCD